MSAVEQARATVLVVDDEPGICRALSGFLDASGHRALTAASAEEALALLDGTCPDVAFVDLRLPGMDGLSLMREIRRIHPSVRIVMITAFGDVDIAIEATQAGAYAYLPKPFDLEEAGRLVERAMSAGTVAVKPSDETPDPASEPLLRGDSSAVKRLRSEIEAAAPAARPVLLAGEVGTGREAAARVLHRRAGDAGSFHSVRCSAVPAGEIENVLEQLRGERAGTWFLSDLGDLAPATAEAVLTAFAGGRPPVARLVASVRSVAGGRESPVEAFVAAQAEEKGWSVLRVPALRDRLDDLPELVSAVLSRVNRELGSAVEGVAPETLALLDAYRWPGNLRELANVLRTAVLGARGAVLLPDSLPASVREATRRAAARGRGKRK